MVTRDVTDLLYKVSAPRDDWTFEPTPFWRAEDWSFSDDAPHPGLVEDTVVFAGRFDDVNLHLLPRVWRLRVWLGEERTERLAGLGYEFSESATAVIFALESDRQTIETFTPTVFTFDAAGFDGTPSDEFVARRPQTALSAESVTMADALRRWNVELVFVADGAALEASLRAAGVDHQIQT